MGKVIREETYGRRYEIAAHEAVKDFVSRNEHTRFEKLFGEQT